MTDEQTFDRVFGKCDWAIMAIIAKGGQSYARLRFGVGPHAEMEIEGDKLWFVALEKEE